MTHLMVFLVGGEGNSSIPSQIELGKCYFKWKTLY